MTNLLIKYTCYCTVGMVLATAGLNYHNWQLWAVLAAMAVNELNEGIHTRKETFKECKKIFSETIVENFK